MFTVLLSTEASHRGRRWANRQVSLSKGMLVTPRKADGQHVWLGDPPAFRTAARRDKARVIFVSRQQDVFIFIS